MDQASAWQAVLSHDASFDGTFVYGVRTTGIYCRPSCPSRRPREEYVSFFDGPDSAEQAGFRACRRCTPRDHGPPPEQTELALQVCRVIDAQQDTPPTLDELAALLHVSSYHLQRVFKRIIGITPRQYADSRRREQLKERLKDQASVTGALYEAGYGSSSSLYEGAVEHLGMTPGMYRNGGRGLHIGYTTVSCSLGTLLVAATEQGVCAIRIGDAPHPLVAELTHEFPSAVVESDPQRLHAWVEAVLRHIDGHEHHLELPLDIRATAFQRRVWEALRAIPYGETRSYSQVAGALGQPEATRAVARACATNPVALVIPCHRVVRADGSLGGYRWGLERKQRLLAQEEYVQATG